MIKNIKRRVKNMAIIIVMTGFIIFIIFTRPLLQSIIFIRKKMKAWGLIAKVHTTFDQKIESLLAAISI